MVAPYQIEFTRAARRAMAALPRPVLKRVDARILALAANPHPPDAKRLKAEANLSRVRVGDYRILYRVADDRLVILVVRIGHRREVYRNL